MVPEIAEADPFVEVAKELAAGQAAAASAPAVTPPPESTPAATAAAEGATEGASEGAAAESPEGAASEAAAEDGTDANGLKALRALVAEDPTLATVPQIRAKLGLAPLVAPAVAAAPGSKDPKASSVLDGVQTEEQALAAYEERMKAGDETGAIRVLARREALVAARTEAQNVVRGVFQQAALASRMEEFTKAHPDWKKHEKAMVEQLRVLTGRGIPAELVEPEELWRLVVRPGPAPASGSDEARKAVEKAAADKKRAAASAAAAPTNQRPAGVAPPSGPAPKPTALDSAVTRVFGDAGADRKARQLYDPERLTRRTA